MKRNLKNGLPKELVEKICKHSAGAEHLKSRAVGCHYCGHMTIIVYENSRGHINAKCRKCNRAAIYNVSLRRSRPHFIPFCGD